MVEAVSIAERGPERFAKATMGTGFVQITVNSLRNTRRVRREVGVDGTLKSVY